MFLVINLVNQVRAESLNGSCFKFKKFDYNLFLSLIARVNTSKINDRKYNLTLLLL